eukprot:7023682-Prymnesium_polylepis.1
MPGSSCSCIEILRRSSSHHRCASAFGSLLKYCITLYPCIDAPRSASFRYCDGPSTVPTLSLPLYWLAAPQITTRALGRRRARTASSASPPALSKKKST